MTLERRCLTMFKPAVGKPPKKETPSCGCFFKRRSRFVNDDGDASKEMQKKNYRAMPFFFFSF
jgi:hypothetical protein